MKKLYTSSYQDSFFKLRIPLKDNKKNCNKGYEIVKMVKTSTSLEIAIVVQNLNIYRVPRTTNLYNSLSRLCCKIIFNFNVPPNKLA